VQLGVHLDPARRPLAELLHAWRDFGRNAASANRAGVRVTVLQASWEDGSHVVDGVTCHFVRDDRPVLQLPGGRTIRRTRMPRLLHRLGQLAPTVIHFEGLLFPRHIRLLAARFPGVPIIAQDHGSRVPTGIRRMLHRWGFAPLAGVMFSAREQAAPFQAANVLPPGLPVFEVMEGSVSFTPGDRARARTETGLAGDPCIFWLGVLDANKDPLTVLDAVDEVAQHRPAVRLWMCYKAAPLLDVVRERIARSNRLRQAVRLLGPLPHESVEQHLRAADFLVQASHKEGSGFGVMEALACGTTPLVTDIPSFRVITGRGAFGGLFPRGDSAALARIIMEWADRDREELRRGAREHFERSLSYAAVGTQLVHAYRSVAAR
jgi:glycosyltransferase involved in cell wall biosynthesis